MPRTCVLTAFDPTWPALLSDNALHSCGARREATSASTLSQRSCRCSAATRSRAMSICALTCRVRCRASSATAASRCSARSAPRSRADTLCSTSYRNPAAAAVVAPAERCEADAEAPANDRCTLQAVHDGLRSQTHKVVSGNIDISAGQQATTALMTDCIGHCNTPASRKIFRLLVCASKHDKLLGAPI